MRWLDGVLAREACGVPAVLRSSARGSISDLWWRFDDLRG
jgi:hypothetical protein